MGAKILIADDEPDVELLVRQRFRKQIRDHEYTFVFAQDGADALAKLQADPEIQVVLTDINMPVMDGLTFLANLEQLNGSVLAVIVSAYGDMPNIRTAMNRGAFDFLTKPIDFTDFEITLKRSLHEVEVLRQAAQNRDRLSALHRELAIASTIQQSILPRTFPPYAGAQRFELFASMKAASNVGGDFFDFFPVGDEKLAVVIGDVSGKGVPAALYMAMARTLLRNIASGGADPGQCLKLLNHALCRDNDGDMFVTLFYGILDGRSGELSYCNGGHNPPFRIPASGKASQLPLTGDMVVGIIDDTDYHTQQIVLASGETLLLYTDGVTEAMDAAGNQFGEERLQQVLEQPDPAPMRQVVTHVASAVKDHAGEAPQSDDLTLLAARCLP